MLDVFSIFFRMEAQPAVYFPSFFSAGQDSIQLSCRVVEQAILPHLPSCPVRSMCGLGLEVASSFSCGADVVGDAFSESAMKMNWACMAAMQGVHEANRMLRGDTN